MKRYLLALFVLAAALPVPAAPIVSVTGTSLGTQLGDALGVSWYQSGTYENVVITASISSHSFTEPGDGAMYLTRSRGPGTTVADEIASINLYNIPRVGPDLTLFSGLTLGPGTYYLTLAHDLGGIYGLGWRATNPDPPVNFAASGNVLGPDMVAAGVGYAPAMTFFLNERGYLFSVSGDVPAAVPEPSTFFLLVPAITIMGWIRLRRT